MPSRTKKSPARKKRAAPRRKSRQAKNISAGEWFEKLVAVQKRLRAPRGCPWDREQTHATLRPYLIEEAYEVLDALDSGDDAKFAEEMGDLLLQVVFHSEIAREQGRFTVADVIQEIHDKMVRRHPHVFGDTSAKNSTEVLKNWEVLKAQERLDKERLSEARLNQARKKNPSRKKENPVPQAPNHTQTPGAPDDGFTSGRFAIREASAPQPVPPKPVSILDGVSRGLPAMLQGLQLTRKAARAGFDWHNADGIFEKLREEMAEVRHALTEKDARKAEEELGDLLFAAINLARFVQVDPEIALKKANAKFQRRFSHMEQAAAARHREFADLPREEMESLWDAVKHQENEAPKTNGAGNSASSQSEDANSSPRANPKPQNSKPQNSKMAASYSR